MQEIGRGNTQNTEKTQNVGAVQKAYSDAEVKSILKKRSKGELVKTVQGLASVVDTHKEREQKIKDFVSQAKKNGFIAESKECEIMEILDGVK